MPRYGLCGVNPFSHSGGNDLMYSPQYGTPYIQSHFFRASYSFINDVPSLGFCKIETWRVVELLVSLLRRSRASD